MQEKLENSYSFHKRVGHFQNNLVHKICKKIVKARVFYCLKKFSRWQWQFVSQYFPSLILKTVENLEKVQKKIITLKQQRACVVINHQSYLKQTECLMNKVHIGDISKREEKAHRQQQQEQQRKTCTKLFFVDASLC